MSHRRGFTLIELIIYVGIFSIAATLLTGVLTTFTRVQLRESATTAVSQEAQFVIQTIQRLVTDASLIELAKDTASSTLKLRMPVAANDPTCIQFSNGTVYLMQGNDGVNKHNCYATSTPQAKALTTSKVVVTTLTFKKFENPPSTDTIKIDLTVSYNSTNPQESAVSRTLQTAIAKVSAATFDSDIIPSADNTYNVGVGANRWKYGFFSGNVGIGTGSPSLTGTGIHIFPSSGDAMMKVQGGTSGNAYFTGSPASGGNMYIANAGYGNLYLGACGVACTSMIVDGAGSVGIGNTSPTVTLHVGASADTTGKNIRVSSDSGDMSLFVQGSAEAGAHAGYGRASKIIGQQASYPMVISNNATQPIVFGTNDTERMRITGTGYVGIGTTPGSSIGYNKVLTIGGASAPALNLIASGLPQESAIATDGNGIYIDVAGNAAATANDIIFRTGRTNSSYTLTEAMRIDGSTGTVSIGSGSGKINAGTIDPIYNIGGTRYATYVPALAGKIREEATGTVTLRDRRAVIDFDDVPRESDLWLFWQITDFGPRWDDLVVIPAPGFNGRVWYEKDVLRNRLIFAGDRSGEVSFRLAAPRFDHEKWPIRSDAETGGFEISEKPQSRSLLPW